MADGLARASELPRRGRAAPRRAGLAAGVDPGRGAAAAVLLVTTALIRLLGPADLPLLGRWSAPPRVSAAAAAGGGAVATARPSDPAAGGAAGRRAARRPRRRRRLGGRLRRPRRSSAGDGRPARPRGRARGLVARDGRRRRRRRAPARRPHGARWPARALLVALALFLRPASDAAGVASAYLMPSRIALVVEPGNARVRAGQSFTVRARLRGAGGRVAGARRRRRTRRRAGADDPRRRTAATSPPSTTSPRRSSITSSPAPGAPTSSRSPRCTRRWSSASPSNTAIPPR